MTRVVALLLALSLPACMFVVSKERRSEVRRLEQWNKPIRTTPPVTVIAAKPRGTGIEIQAVMRSMCDATGDLTIETRVHTGATIKVYDICRGSRDCGWLILFALVAAPMTLTISGLITAGIVIGADDRIEAKTQPLPTRHFSCDTPGAGLHVRVMTPGREPVLATTDTQGATYVELGDVSLAAQTTVEAVRE